MCLTRPKSKCLQGGAHSRGVLQQPEQNKALFTQETVAYGMNDFLTYIRSEKKKSRFLELAQTPYPYCDFSCDKLSMVHI